MSHETNRTRFFHKEFVNPETEGGKIAMKCRERLLCIRGHLEYTHSRINDRSDCPESCCLNRHFNFQELDRAYHIDDNNHNFGCNE